MVEIVLGVAQLLIGTYFLALAVAGFFKRELPWWTRAVFFVVALGFISPDVISTVAALVVGVVLVAWITMTTKKVKTA